MAHPNKDERSQPLPRTLKPDLAKEIMEISRRCAALPDLDTRDPDEVLGYGDMEALPPRSADPISIVDVTAAEPSRPEPSDLKEH